MSDPPFLLSSSPDRGEDTKEDEIRSRFSHRLPLPFASSVRVKIVSTAVASSSPVIDISIRMPSDVLSPRNESLLVATTSAAVDASFAVLFSLYPPPPSSFTQSTAEKWYQARKDMDRHNTVTSQQMFGAWVTTHKDDSARQTQPWLAFLPTDPEPVGRGKTMSEALANIQGEQRASCFCGHFAINYGKNVAAAVAGTPPQRERETGREDQREARERRKDSVSSQEDSEEDVREVMAV